MKSTHQPSFKPVELIVVLLAATVLAALLFPVFSQARLKASQGICLTNMKQVLVAASMYSFDYDGKLPVSTSSDSTEKVVPLKPIGVYR